ncbi:MAG: SpoIIE family protein phosphatase [Coriobacteriales bacterium]|nr:SpoIIE family protein phosphatase [Coriobacteriales bacterium]
MNKLTGVLQQLTDEKHANAITFAVLTVFGMSLLFLQLAFFPLGLNSNAFYFHTSFYYIPFILAVFLLPLRQYAAFVVVMCLGLMLHSAVMPIDYYEAAMGRFPVVLSTALSGGVLFWLCKIAIERLRKKLHCDDKPTFKSAAVIVVVMLGAALLMGLASVLYSPSASQGIAGYVTKPDTKLEVLCDTITYSLAAILCDILMYRSAKLAYKKTLQSVFQRALLLVMIVAFLITTTVGYCLETYRATTLCDEKLDSTLDYLADQVEQSKERYDSIKAAQDRVMIETAASAAEMLVEAKGNVTDMQAYVESINRAFFLTSFTVCDANGTVEYDSDGKGIGTFNFGSTEATKPYLDLIDGKVPYIVEEPRNSVDENGETSTMHSFAGVPRADKKGFIQISMDTTDYASEVEQISLNHLLDNYHLDASGVVVLVANADIISSNEAEYRDTTTYDLLGLSAEEVELGGDELETAANDQLFRDELKTMKDPDSAEFVYYKGRPVEGYYVLAMLPSLSVFSGRTSIVVRNTIIYLVLFASVFVLISLLLKRLVTESLERTNGVLSLITEGDLDQKVEERGVTEFSELSDGINTTVVALKDSIAEAAARYDKDLATAKAIQESALPSTFPPFPEVEAFDIYASMNAAREVGGDFYDFFLIDDHTLGFLIADVSGKGIPASLFMMAAKNQIYNYMGTGMDLADAIATANARLCEGNDAGMFVTVWAATLDWETGLLTYVNAGHNFPLLRHNGEWTWLKKKCGLFLGTFERAKYRKATLVLEPGDELILYTDGVNEAFSRDEEEYGNDRLEAFLGTHNAEHPRELVLDLRGDVATWACGAEQSDDITMLALEYGVKPEVTASMSVPARLNQLPRIMDFIHAELDKRLCPIGIEHKIDIALEEMLVNVCNYAYADKDTVGPVTVTYTYTPDPARIAIMIEDEGIPFDPLTRKDPTMPDKIQDVPIGGLGIMMTKRMVDDISYVRDGNRNQLVFTKGW